MAALIWIPTVEIEDEGDHIQPLEPLFKTFALYKMMLQFDEPFWRDEANNVGGFKLTDDAGEESSMRH